MANPEVVKQSLTPPDFTDVAASKLADLLEKGFVITGVCFERQVEGTQPQRGFVDFAGFVGWWQADVQHQPKLTVRLTSFPESNGRRNWTALLVRKEKWGGLIGNCGGISLARGELWNRVAYEAECARFLIGERETEPFILDYGDDITTPDDWAGERGRKRAHGITAHGVADMKGGQDVEA